jgi:transposase
MDKDDARKLSPAEQHERRRQVIRAHKRGRTKTQIAEEIGLSYTAVSKVITRYEAEGIGAVVRIARSLSSRRRRCRASSVTNAPSS